MRRAAAWHRATRRRSNGTGRRLTKGTLGHRIELLKRCQMVAVRYAQMWSNWLSLIKEPWTEAKWKKNETAPAPDGFPFLTLIYLKHIKTKAHKTQV